MTHIQSHMKSVTKEQEYTSYKVKGILKPQYVGIVQRFCRDHQWNATGDSPGANPRCIQEWISFQDTVHAYKVIDGRKYYNNGIPIGLPSPWWGSECIVYEDHTHDNTWWWSFSGETKNEHAQIEQFVHCVVGQLCSRVDIFWTCKESETCFTTHATHSIHN